jgi:hypothetical protein
MIPLRSTSSVTVHMCILVLCVYIHESFCVLPSKSPVHVNVYHPHHNVLFPTKLKIAVAEKGLAWGTLSSLKDRSPTLLEFSVCHWPVTG